MPAVSLVPRGVSLVTRNIVKRGGNFASKNPGVIVVFAVVGCVALLLISLWAHKKMAARKKAKGTEF